MPFVLDALVTAVWALEDENHPLAVRALDRLRTDEAVAPSLWWFEVRNILIVNERRKRLSEADTRRFLEELAVLPIREDRMAVEDEVLRLARVHGLTVYDAAYLELALRERLVLATLDQALVRAAAVEGVETTLG